jgi:protein-S-isoprenylcysteine O-methyltransferase Ste14
MWARHYLGTNWSATVSVKKNHELITSGPYQFVRHPIYTGLIIAFIGTAMAQGELRSLLAPLIVIAAFRRKWLHEERWMLETFGEQYIAYKIRVPALIPFLRWRNLR